VYQPAGGFGATCASVGGGASSSGIDTTWAASSGVAPGPGQGLSADRRPEPVDCVAVDRRVDGAALLRGGQLDQLARHVEGDTLDEDAVLAHRAGHGVARSTGYEGHEEEAEPATHLEQAERDVVATVRAQRGCDLAAVVRSAGTEAHDQHADSLPFSTAELSPTS
jgi:hypothetical protein